MNSLENKKLREEYTRLRSAAMKRVKRAQAKGFGFMPNIEGVQYILPPLRTLSPDDYNDTETLRQLVIEANRFLSAPTTLRGLQKTFTTAIKNLVDTEPKFAEFLKIDKGRAFYRYVLQASATATEKLQYLSGVKIIETTYQRLAYDYIKEDFGRWLLEQRTILGR